MEKTPPQLEKMLKVGAVMTEKELQDLERHVKAKPNGYKENRDECWFITKVQRQKILNLIAEVRRLQDALKGSAITVNHAQQVIESFGKDIERLVKENNHLRERIKDSGKGAVEGE